MVQQRVLVTGRVQFLFRVTPAARGFLLMEGTDTKCGARHLKRAIEKFVVCPLANLRVTEQVRFGDVLLIDWDGSTNHLSFEKEGEGVVVPAASPLARRKLVHGPKANSGKVVEVLAAAKSQSELDLQAACQLASNR